MSLQGQSGFMRGGEAVVAGRVGLLLAIVFAVAAFPLLYVQMPPVMDYPNHLARLWLLAGGAQHPPLSGFYVVEWSRASTNVAVDWLAARMGTLIGPVCLDRTLRLLMFLGPPAGAAYLARTAFGRWSIWHASMLMLAWTTTAIAGFMSYSISLCAALFAASIFLKRGLSLSFAGLFVHLVVSGALLAIHPFGLFFYLALLTGVAIGPDRRSLTTTFGMLSIAYRLLVFAIISSCVVIALFFLSPHPPSTSHVLLGSLSSYLSLRRIVLTLLSPILTYSFAIDCLFTLPVVALIAFAAVKKWLTVHLGLLIVAGALALLSIAAPQEFGDASWLDRRFPLMAALTLASSLMPLLPSRRAAAIFYGILLSAVVGKSLWITSVWLARDNELGDLLAVTRTITPGESVIVVRHRGTDHKDQPVGRYMIGGPGEPRPVRRHLPALLVPFREAFIPTLFSISGQQPLRVSHQKLRDAVTSSSIPFVDELRRGSATDPYIARLDCDFQGVLLIGADEKPYASLQIPSLRLVSAKGMFSLYKVIKHPGHKSCRSY